MYVHCICIVSSAVMMRTVCTAGLFTVNINVNVTVYWSYYGPSTYTMENGCQTLLRHRIWTSFPLVWHGKTCQKGGKGVLIEIEIDD
jgi:hypothetical protein